MDAYQKQLLAQSVATAGATAAFSAVPFVGPILGPAMGGIVGNQVGKLFEPKKKVYKAPIDVRAGSTGMQYGKGGFLPISKGKMLVKGNNHNDSTASGVKVGGVELEGGEVITKMALGGSLGNQFVFSKRLKNTGTGKSFADTAKGIKSEKELLKLAVKQETIKNTSSESKVLGNGGKIKYADGGYLPYASSALNVGMALFGKQHTTNLPNVNTSAVDRMETSVNVQPQIQEIKNANQSAIVGTGNNLNSALASQAITANAISKVYSDKTNQETQLKNQKTSAYLGLAEQQRQIEAQRAQEELAGKQARVNMLTEGLIQAGNTYLNQKADANKIAKERAGLNIQAGLIPDAKVRDRVMADINNLYTPAPKKTLLGAIQAYRDKREYQRGVKQSDDIWSSIPGNTLEEKKKALKVQDMKDNALSTSTVQSTNTVGAGASGNYAPSFDRISLPRKGMSRADYNKAVALEGQRQDNQELVNKISIGVVNKKFVGNKINSKKSSVMKTPSKLTPTPNITSFVPKVSTDIVADAREAQRQWEREQRKK